MYTWLYVKHKDVQTNIKKKQWRDCHETQESGYPGEAKEFEGGNKGLKFGKTTGFFNSPGDVVKICGEFLRVHFIMP
jgi:hypothetical protein